MNKVQKMAAQDAYEYGLAEMFFGEGAGTRRKLIGATVNQRMADVPGYLDAFDKAFGELNQTEMAEKAISLRKKIDRTAKAGRNLRALRSGRLHNLTTGVAFGVGCYYLAKATGYDKKIEAEMKKTWARIKEETSSLVNARKIREAKNTVYNITNVSEEKPASEDAG